MSGAQSSQRPGRLTLEHSGSTEPARVHGLEGDTLSEGLMTMTEKEVWCSPSQRGRREDLDALARGENEIFLRAGG